MKTLGIYHKLSDSIIDMDKEHITNLRSIWFDIVPKKWQPHLKEMTGREYILQYLESDITLTTALRKFYWGTTLSIAETLNVPLSHSVGRSNGMPSTITILQELEKNNMVILDSNLDRYPEAYGRYHKYRGAKVYVNNNYTGIYVNKPKKCDFLSMYPSSMLTWHLGLDTLAVCKMDLAVLWEQLTDDQDWVTGPD